MEIIKEVINKIHFQQVMKSVMDKGLEKLAISVVSATFLDLFEVFLLLMLLELIDIYTACVYQSSLLWKAMYDPKIIKRYGNLVSYTRTIWNAHHWRFIESGLLKDGFLSKTITYFCLICTGTAIDAILAIRHTPQLALTIFCMVMALTEGLSICENLDSAGVKIGGELRDLLKKRKEEIK